MLKPFEIDLLRQDLKEALARQVLTREALDLGIMDAKASAAEFRRRRCARVAWYGAFPIMLGSCAFLMPVAGLRFIASRRYDLRAARGRARGGCV